MQTWLQRFPRRRFPSSPGHPPYMEIRCRLLQQTTITTACNRAREGTPKASPNRRRLSPLFLAEIPVSD